MFRLVHLPWIRHGASLMKLKEDVQVVHSLAITKKYDKAHD